MSKSIGVSINSYMKREEVASRDISNQYTVEIFVALRKLKISV